MAGYARHVLVIEDDAETAEQLVDCLKTGGYEVDLGADGEDGLRRALAADYVVITVDRMLPRIDGIEVIRRLRQQGIVTPALILSALGEVDDRVRGLRRRRRLSGQALCLSRGAGAGRRACPPQRDSGQGDDAAHRRLGDRSARAGRPPTRSRN